MKIKQLFRFRLPEHPVLLLTTFLIGFGMTWPLLLVSGLTAQALSAAIACAAVSAFFLLLDCLPGIRSAAYPLLFAAILSVLFLWRDSLAGLSASLIMLYSGTTLPLLVFAEPIALLLSFVLTGIGAHASRAEHPFVPVACYLLLATGILLYSGGDGYVLCLLPLLLALLLLAASSETKMHSRIFPTLAALVLAFALYPMLAPLSSAFQQTTRDVRKTLADYLFFTDARTPFSLTTTGWQPLGADRLGGPIYGLSEEPLLQVSVSSRALLRGTLRNTYTGFAWEDTTEGTRYLLISPRAFRLRSNVFDRNRPASALSARLPAPENIRVLLLQDASSTLWMTQRFRSLSGPDIVPYFSPSSEIFATRSLAEGDLYTFQGSLFTADTEGIRDLVLAAGASGDTWYERSILSEYLALPQNLPEELRQLAERLTSGDTLDFDRAMTLCSWLRTSFPYTLNQHVPPLDTDFVSWFLFEEKQGYCTSFASAMVVLCRTLGLPARYVEGFAALPDETGNAIVTAEHAHAWAEVYFPGFGWLAFDPTPTENDAQDERETPPPPDPSPSPTPTESPEGSTPPVPTPSPTPKPTPSAPPSVTPTPSPAPTLPPETDPPENRFQPWILLLLLLLLVLLAALRLYFAAPAVRAKREKSSNRRLMIWYSAVLEVLRQLKLTPSPGEAPATFLARAGKQTDREDLLDRLGKAVCIAQYSGKRVAARQVRSAEKAYLVLLHHLSPVRRIFLYLHRLFSFLPFRNSSKEV